MANNQVYIGIIPDDYVDFLLEAARDVNISDNVFVCNLPIEDEDGAIFEDPHVTIYSDKPECSKELWERYGIRVSKYLANLNSEIERIINAPWKS